MKQERNDGKLKEEKNKTLVESQELTIMDENPNIDDSSGVRKIEVVISVHKEAIFNNKVNENEVGKWSLNSIENAFKDNQIIKTMVKES